MKKILLSLCSLLSFSAGAKSAENYKDTLFLSYYQDLTIKDKFYMIRFAVPTGWQYDKRDGEVCLAFFVEGDEHSIKAVISFLLLANPTQDLDHAPEALQKALSKIEETSKDTGDFKDKELSLLKTYDNRSVIVLSDTSKEGTTTKKIFVPLTEDLRIVVAFSFTFVHDDQIQFNEKLKIFKTLLRSLKITPIEKDIQEREKYMKDIICLSSEMTSRDIDNFPVEAVSQSIDPDNMEKSLNEIANSTSNRK